MRLLATLVATVVAGLLVAAAAGAAGAPRTCGAMPSRGIERLQADGTACSNARRVARAWDEECTDRATSRVRSPCRARRYRCMAANSRFLAATVTCTRGDREVRFAKAFLRRMM